MENTDYLGKEKVGKLILKFAIPCILSLLVASLYNIVDQIFIGNSPVGSMGINATTIVYPITVITLALGLMLGNGCAAYLSLCLGKGEKDKLPKAVGTSLLFSFIASMVCYAIFFPLLDKVLVAFGAHTADSLAYSHEYGFIILIGFPFAIIMTTMNSIIRADGSPKMAMISMLAGAITNIILDALIINVWNMGLTGAALATIIGQIVSFVISSAYFFKTKTFKLNLRSFIPDFKVLGEICKLGISSLLTQVSIVIMSVVSMNMLAEYGSKTKYGIEEPQAIFGIVTKVFSIVINIVVGIAAGSQPVIGYNYGAKNYKRVKQGYWIVVISTAVVCLIATLLFQTIPSQIIQIFGSNTKNPELYYEFGAKTIRIYLMLVLLTCIGKVTSIFLQAISSPVKSLFLSLLRDVILFVPLTILLPRAMGLDGVLWAAPISDIIAMFVVVLFVFLEFRKMKNGKDDENGPTETIPTENVAAESI